MKSKIKIGGAVILFTLILISCGSNGESGSIPRSSEIPQEKKLVSLESLSFDVFNWVRVRSAEISVCTKFGKGHFREIEFKVWVDGSFTGKCVENSSNCRSEVILPSTIIIENFDLMEHNIIHWLHFVNIGTLDENHDSLIWERCDNRGGSLFPSPF